MTKKLDDDITTQRLKLEEVSRLVADYERQVNSISGHAYVEALTQSVSDAPRLLAALKEKLKPLAATGFATSLTENDMKTIRTRLGSRYQRQYEACWREFHACCERISKLGDQPDSQDLMDAVISLATAVLRLLDVIGLPACLLRDELVARLRRAKGEKESTEGQRARAVRDDRIRQLARANATESPAAILKLAQKDPAIRALRVKVSIDIVRKLIKPRRGRRKTRG